MEDVLPVLRSFGQLRSKMRSWRVFGETVALVPLVPDLEPWQEELVHGARDHCDRVIAAFMPLPSETGERFRLASEADLDLLDLAGVDAIYLPDASRFFTDCFATKLSVDGVGSEMGSNLYPRHLIGFVKLLNQVRADCTVLAEPETPFHRALMRVSADLDIQTKITLVKANGLSSDLPPGLVVR